MPELEDLRAYSASRYDVESASDDGFTLQARIKLRVRSGEELHVHPLRVHSQDEDCCWITSPIGPAQHLSPATALTKNRRFVLGGIALEGNELVFVCPIAFEGLSQARFLGAAHLVVETAALLRRELGMPALQNG